MSKKPTMVVSLDGPSIVLRDGDQLISKRVLIQLPVYGRVLFTENCGVRVEGQNVQIKHCDLIGL